MVPSRVLVSCLMVVSTWVTHVAPLAEQAVDANSASELRIVALRATKDYTFVVFQPPTAVKKDEEGKPLLEVQIYKANDSSSDSSPTTAKDLEGPYIDFESKHFERFEDYVIKVVEKKATETAPAPHLLLEGFKSSPGTPSPVVLPDWEMVDSSKARLHWDKPSEPKGPIDGYEIVNCHRGIINIDQRDGEGTKGIGEECEKHVTRDTKIEIEVQRGRRHNTTIRAFNTVEAEFGESGLTKLYSEPCFLYPTNDKTLPEGGNNAAVAVLIVISVLLSLVIVGYAGYKYYRKNYN